MYSLSYAKFLRIAATVLVVMQTSSSARADDFVENLGEPIITAVGYKRVIAFQRPHDNHCALHAVVWDTRDTGTSVARVRVALGAGQIVHIDTVENETLNIQCDTAAKTLSVVDKDERVAFGLASQHSDQTLTATASDF